MVDCLVKTGLSLLLKTGLRLMKNVIKPSVKINLISIGLTAATAVADAGIYKKILRSGHPSSSALHNNSILIISHDEMKKIIEKV